MAKADPIVRGRMRRSQGVCRLAVGALLPVILVLAGASEACADDARWTVQLEPMLMDAFGNDQHVLTSRVIDVDATPAVETKTPVSLDSEKGPGFRLELRHTRENWDDWGLGFDFFWFSASQGRPGRTAAASGASGPIDSVVFAAANREFTSSDPDDVLFFNVLEDTDINTWTADLYATRTLLKAPDHGFELQLGLRNADFDDDIHTVVGIQDVAGSVFDAASNYGRMIGPLVGFAGDFQFGRNTIRGYFGQSIVFGTADLKNATSDFTGPFSDTPAVVAESSFREKQDAAIPITEFRITWTYRITDRISLGLTANSSVWWDVPVPPGIVPLADADEVFHENTIRYVGLGAVVKVAL